MSIKTPTTVQELYHMMLENSKLCGNFKLVDNCIFWDLYDNIWIEISANSLEFLCEINTKNLFCPQITHWHPAYEDVYRDICSIGEEDSVMVLQKVPFHLRCRYIGKIKNCPYSINKKFLFGKTYWLYTKNKA